MSSGFRSWLSEVDASDVLLTAYSFGNLRAAAEVHVQMCTSTSRCEPNQDHQNASFGSAEAATNYKGYKNNVRLCSYTSAAQRNVSNCRCINNIRRWALMKHSLLSMACRKLSRRNYLTISCQALAAEHVLNSPREAAAWDLDST